MMKTARLTSLIRILDSAGQAPQRLRMEQLPALFRNKRLPEKTRQAALDLTKMTARLIAEGKICPISVADQMLEEIEQIQRDLKEAEKTAQSLMQELEKRPDQEKDGRVQDLSSKIGTLEIELDQATKEARDKETRLQGEVLRIESLESKIKGLTGELAEIREAKEAAEQRARSLKDSLDQSELALENALAEKVAAEENIETIVEEKQGLERQIDLQKNMLGKRDSVIKNLNKSLQQAQAAKEVAERNVQELSTRAMKLDAELDETKKQLKQKENVLKRVRAQRDTAHDEILRSNNRIGSLETELKGAQEETRRKEAGLRTALREKTEAKTALHTHLAEGERMRDEAKELIAQVNTLRKERDHARELKEKRDETNVKLHMDFQRVREEKEALLKTHQELRSQLKTIRIERDQARGELIRTKKKADPFLKLQKIWESIEPEAFGAWLVLFNLIDKQIEDLNDKREMFFVFVTIADHLIRTGASNIYLYFRNLDPEEKAQLLDRITSPQRYVMLPQHKEKWSEEFKKITNLPVPNQLRLLMGPSLNPQTYEQVIQHLILYNLDEVRDSRNAKDEPLKEAANMVWGRWLWSILEYFSKHPQNKGAYARQLAAFAGDEAALEALKIIGKDPNKKLRSMARKVRKEAFALARAKKG